MSRIPKKKGIQPGRSGKTILGLSTKMFAVLLVGLVAGGSAAVYFLFLAPGSPFAIGPGGPEDTTPPPEVKESIKLRVYCTARSSTGDPVLLSSVSDYGNPQADASLYSYNTTGKTSGQITTLTFADLTLEGTNKTANFSLAPEPGLFYFVNISYPGFSEKWLQFTDRSPTLFFNVETMQIGDNYIYLLNKSVNAKLLIHNSTIGTDLSVSTDDFYKVLMSFDSNDQGFTEGFNVLTGHTNYLGLRVQYNTSAAMSWTNLIGSTPATKKISGNYLFLFLSGPFFGSSNYKESNIGMGGTPGVDYTVVDMALIYGSPDSLGTVQVLAVQ